VRTLSERRLNRALLARQLLLERARLPLPRALERMGTLQAQYAPSMYVGLWSRVEGFERDDLTRALEARTVVQGTLMRTTIHLVSATDYWPLAVAVRQARRDSWMKAIGSRGVTVAELEAAAGRLRERLREGPVRRAELDAIVGKGNAIPAGLWLDLVRVPPSGTWERRRADLYAAAEDWLGPPTDTVTPDDGVEHLVGRYLTGFGPATAADIADWGGLHPSAVTPVLERMELRRFVDERGQVLVDLPRAPLPDPDTPAPVRFLPTWDAMLLVHTRRKGVLAEAHRARIFNTKTPHSVCTFLVDGTVAGTWRYERGEVVAAPFEPLDPETADELEAEAARLAVMHG
jgi:Winged helix DNA-binding domain